MKTKFHVKMILFFFIFLLFFPILINGRSIAATDKQLVYDYAGLLQDDEIARLEELAHKYGEKRQTDILILTTDDTKGKDVVKYMQDFYDDNAPGYDKPHGNTAILTIDMQNREVYLAGFYKAEKYLDDERLDQIRDKITPDLSNGNYEQAFETFIKTSYRYMGFHPGVNPDNPLFNSWIQIIISVGLGGLVVGIMAYHSGGRVTINARTYQDSDRSRVLHRRDNYIRTTTTKRRKPQNNSSGGSGGGGGGGRTSGGHSHSGSRGSF